MQRLEQNHEQNEETYYLCWKGSTVITKVKLALKRINGDVVIKPLNKNQLEVKLRRGSEGRLNPF